MMSLKTCLINLSFERHKPFLFLKRLKGGSKSSDYDPRQKALEHFDDFYKALFNKRWPSVRLGLHSKQKYVAVLNNFADIEKTEKLLQNHGAFDLRKFLEVHKAEYQKSKPKKSPEEEKEVELGERIREKLEQEEVREMSGLHPEAMDFMSEVEVLDEENDKQKGTQKLEVHPDMLKTSLHSDLSSSQIDRSRMIEPEEGTALSNLSNYIPVTKLRGLDDYVPESEYYKYYQTSVNVPITVEKEFDLDFPESLTVYTFDRGDISEFPLPSRSTGSVQNFLEVEGSDVLATLALGVKAGDRVLDLCSFKGEKAYCIFQTLRPEVLVCVAGGRKSTPSIFSSHLYNYPDAWKEMLLITNSELSDYRDDQLFDKVLITVPSTKDKLSILEETSNAFHVRNIQRRLRLPATQAALLQKAFTLVRPGGTVLYVTSTLSPIQNDGVVSAALKTAWDTTKEEFIVKDLTPALEHTSVFFRFGDFLNMKYGTLVVPFAPCNFGPKYFCKIVKKAKAE